ncbi:MAG TPA: response regulator, partial [bacterium]
LSLVLQRHDYAVMQAQNGPEALKVLDQEPCDFVVSDIRMSPMDGYTLASLIQKKHPSVGIVFMSAFGFEDQVAGSDPSSTRFPRLTKPFPVSDLIKVLKEEEHKRQTLDILLQEARPNKRVALLGVENRNRDVLRMLETMGFQAILIPPGSDILERLGDNVVDLYLVDEAIAEGDDWRALNAVDQTAPHKPVLMLTDRPGTNKSYPGRDFGLAVVDRKRFLNDSHWAKALLIRRMA